MRGEEQPVSWGFKMHDAFRSIDPNGISINADGSVSFQNASLLSATSKLAIGGPVPNSDNFGSCTNGGTCSGSNLDCNNTGNCTNTQNYGSCTSPGMQ
jgi:hypothetical protein